LATKGEETMNKQDGPQETKGTGQDKGMIIVDVQSQDDDGYFRMTTFPKKDGKRMQNAITVSQTQYKLPAHVKKIMKEVSEQAAEAYLMRTTFFEKEGLPRKSINEVKTFYMDILQNTADRILNHPRYTSDPVFRKQAFKKDQIRVKFIKDLEQVFQRQFGNFKKILYNTRTKGKTIADIYTVKKAEIATHIGKIPKAQVQTRTFGRLLIDGFIPLFLSHPNTPTAVINSIMEDFKAFLQNNTTGGPYDQRRRNIDDFLVPYMMEVLTLPKLGRKGVDDVIRALSKKMTPKNAWIFESLADNPITTGDQLTKMFDILGKVIPQNRQSLNYLEPAFSKIARNGKLSKSIRDKMIGIDLGIDCNPDESMNIRVALASNPNLPKKDLQTLANDPCMSVAVVARHYLKRRFK
jgi:hypothetical protein